MNSREIEDKERKEYQLKIQGLNNMLHQTTYELSEAQSKLAETHNHIVHLNDDLINKQNEVNNKNPPLLVESGVTAENELKLKAENLELVAKLQQNKLEIQLYNEEILALKEQLSSLDFKLKTIEHNEASLRTELEQKKNIIKTITDSTVDLQQEMSKVTDERNKLKKELSDKHILLFQLENTISELHHINDNQVNNTIASKLK